MCRAGWQGGRRCPYGNKKQTERNFKRAHRDTSVVEARALAARYEREGKFDRAGIENPLKNKSDAWVESNRESINTAFAGHTAINPMILRKRRPFSVTPVPQTVEGTTEKAPRARVVVGGRRSSLFSFRPVDGSPAVAPKPGKSVPVNGTPQQKAVAELNILIAEQKEKMKEARAGMYPAGRAAAERRLAELRAEIRTKNDVIFALIAEEKATSH
jgi:hypothetical protein